MACGVDSNTSERCLRSCSTYSCNAQGRLIHPKSYQGVVPRARGHFTKTYQSMLAKQQGGTSSHDAKQEYKPDNIGHGQK